MDKREAELMAAELAKALSPAGRRRLRRNAMISLEDAIYSEPDEDIRAELQRVLRKMGKRG